MTPLTHPPKKIDQMDSKNKDMGVVLYVREEVYQSTLTFRRRTRPGVQQCQGQELVFCP